MPRSDAHLNPAWADCDLKRMLTGRWQKSFSICKRQWHSNPPRTYLNASGTFDGHLGRHVNDWTVCEAELPLLLPLQVRPRAYCSDSMFCLIWVLKPPSTRVNQYWKEKTFLLPFSVLNNIVRTCKVSLFLKSLSLDSHLKYIKDYLLWNLKEDASCIQTWKQVFCGWVMQREHPRVCSSRCFRTRAGGKRHWLIWRIHFQTFIW